MQRRCREIDPDTGAAPLSSDEPAEEWEDEDEAEWEEEEEDDELWEEDEDEF
jgi:hypothetical protein